jgi:hypothetical protein
MTGHAPRLTCASRLRQGYHGLPERRTQPWASEVNVDRDAETLSAHATTRVGTVDAIEICTQSGVHLVVDVMGWYRN